MPWLALGSGTGGTLEITVALGESGVQIQLTGRRVEITDEVRDYVYNKAAKLPRFYDRIRDVEVVLDHESEQLTGEMIVRAGRKHTFVARESGSDACMLIDLLVEKLERQLVRHKERNRNHKHDGKVEPLGGTD